MKIEQLLIDIARRSGLLGQLESQINATARQIRDRQIAQERETKRQRILEALDRTGLTSEDAKRLLRWAEPGILNAEEALRLIDALHTAVDNVRSGPGILSESKLARGASLNQKIKNLMMLYDPATSRSDRLRIVKTMSWWNELVDALYRGELEAARQKPKTRGRASKRPSEIAEGAVAAVVCMSTSWVHTTCQSVRDETRGRHDDLLRPMRLETFLQWLDSGGHLFSETS